MTNPIDFKYNFVYIDLVKTKKGEIIMKKFVKVLLTISLVVFTIVIANFSVSAETFDSEMQYQTENMVTVYSRKEYKGKSKEYGVGEYASLDIDVDSIDTIKDCINIFIPVNCTIACN